MNWAYISDVLDHAVLPALTIVVGSAAGWIVGMRNVMITTMDEDYVLIAQAKGLPRRRVIWYAARNAILPSVSGFSLAIGFVVSGALLTEIVFSYPGLGFMLLQRRRHRATIPLLQGIFLVITFAVLAANLIGGLRVRRSSTHASARRPDTMSIGMTEDRRRDARHRPGPCRRRDNGTPRPRDAACPARQGADRAGDAAVLPRAGDHRPVAGARTTRPPAPPPTSRLPQPPSAAHWLGTTQVQQDVLSQLLVGGRSTILVAFVAGLVATVLSIGVGVTAGLHRRPRPMTCCPCWPTSSW